MNSPSAAWGDELDFAKDLAMEAAEVARTRATQVRPQEKSNQSYVTDLDHDLERLIRDRIAARFPNDQLTGEEYEASGGSGPRRWSIDPIDGTGNLVHHLPIWAVSIGLLDAGQPILGVIVLPILRELYWATLGGGAWCNGEPIQAAPDADGFHNQDNVHLNTNALRVLDSRTIPGRLRTLGSCCAELVWASSGRLVSLCHLGEHAHDLAAGIVIAQEAGCQFGTVDGKILSSAEFVAATPVKTPTFTAPPRRLAWLMANAKRLP